MTPSVERLLRPKNWEGSIIRLSKGEDGAFRVVRWDPSSKAWVASSLFVSKVMETPDTAPEELRAAGIDEASPPAATTTAA